MQVQRDWVPDGRPPATSDPVNYYKLLIRHKSLIALGVVIALVLGAIHYSRITPMYQSSSNVLIVNKRPGVVAGGDTQIHLMDYMSTQGTLITSPLIVGRAVEKSNLGSLRSFAGLSSVDAVVMGGLSVSTGSNDNILTVSFRSTVPEDCPTVINAVVDSYKEFLSETYDTMSASAVDLMSESRDMLLLDLREQEEAYRKFREDSPLISAGEDRGNPAHARLSSIQTELSHLQLRHTDLTSQLTSIEKAVAEQRSQEYLTALVTNLARGSDHYGDLSSRRRLSEQLEDILMPLMQKEKDLEETYGQSYPELVSLRRQIQDVRDSFERRQLRAASEGKVQEQQSFEWYVDYLKQELDRIETSQQLLDGLYEKQYAAVKELTKFELTDQEFQRNMSRTQQLYDGLIEQLHDASLVQQYGGFKADVIAPPKIGRQVQPDANAVFSTSILLGLGLGVVLALLADMTYNRFRTPDEIRSDLELPILGLVPQSSASASIVRNGDSTGKSLDRSLCTYHRPMSAETESYRSVRTGLFFGNRGKTHQVIQVTSPCPGDGKSTVASNLSVSIAQSGKRVLLIDADLRRPIQHHLFSTPSDSGLSTVIAMDDEIDDAVCDTPVDNLWLLPAGPLPPDPSELLMSPRLEELISIAREQYDYVIIDSGPMIAVSDPSVVMSRVDGLVLAIRLANTPRRQAVRTRDILASMNAPVLGVVVNAIRGAEAREYGYGKYGKYYHRGPEHKPRLNGHDVRNGESRNGAEAKKPVAASAAGRT